MKSQHKENALNHLESIAKHNKVIKEMLSGDRPPNQKEAFKLNNQIDRLVEITKNLIDLS